MDCLEQIEIIKANFVNIGEEFQGFFTLVNHIAEFKDARDTGLLTGGQKNET